MNTPQNTLNAAGFVLVNTGGNCTAYERFDGQIRETITLAIDPSAPTLPGDVCTVYTTEVDADTDTDRDTATFADIVRVLEHPSDEYHLLSLRLANLR